VRLVDAFEITALAEDGEGLPGQVVRAERVFRIANDWRPDTPGTRDPAAGRT